MFKSVKYNDNAIFVEPVPWLFKQLVENYDKEMADRLINKQLTNINF